MSSLLVQLAEIVELLAIADDTAVLLRQIEWLPAGQQRMLKNIRRLLRMIKGKVGDLSVIPDGKLLSQQDCNDIRNALFDYEMGFTNRAQAEQTLMQAGYDLPTVVVLLSYVDCKVEWNRQHPDEPFMIHRDDIPKVRDLQKSDGAL